MVKEAAPLLLRKELASRKWKPQTLAMSGVTDCCQPVERRLQLTRKCLEVRAEFRNPVSIVTKNHLVTRDSDLLRELARWNAIQVHFSINSLDGELARRLEPRASSPRHRLAAVEALTNAGIPVGVLVAPIIPGLNGHEIASVLEEAGKAGAQWAGMQIIRLPLNVAPIFQDWLERNEPGKKAKVLERIRSVRGGKLNDPRFGERMSVEGAFQWTACGGFLMRRGTEIVRLPLRVTAIFELRLAQTVREKGRVGGSQTGTLPRTFSGHRRTLIASKRSPTKTICFTDLSPLLLSRFSKKPLLHQPAPLALVRLQRPDHGLGVGVYALRFVQRGTPGEEPFEIG